MCNLQKVYVFSRTFSICFSGCNKVIIPPNLPIGSTAVPPGDWLTIKTSASDGYCNVTLVNPDSSRYKFQLRFYEFTNPGSSCISSQCPFEHLYIHYALGKTQHILPNSGPYCGCKRPSFSLSLLPSLYKDVSFEIKGTFEFKVYYEVTKLGEYAIFLQTIGNDFRFPFPRRSRNIHLS